MPPPESGKWVNVTDTLRQAQGSLALGEMLHVPHFTVEQAMTAIEIGDPRMDAGPDAGVELQAQLDSDQLQPALSVQQSAVLLDYLISKLVQWWSGRSLQQTVYTSLHVLGHNRLDAHPVPRAIASLVLALVSMCKTIIQDSGVIHVRRLPCRVGACLPALAPRRHQGFMSAGSQRHSRLLEQTRMRVTGTCLVGALHKVLDASQSHDLRHACVQDEDCSAYSVVPDEAQLTPSMARGLDAQVAAATDVCKSSGDADTEVAQALAVRLEFLQQLLTVRLCVFLIDLESAMRPRKRCFPSRQCNLAMCSPPHEQRLRALPTLHISQYCSIQPCS